MPDTIDPVFKNHTSFLDLSIEIRMMIYDHFFHGVTLRSEHHHDRANRTDQRLSRGNSLPHSYSVPLKQGMFRRYSNITPKERSENFTSLLRVNRFIGQEALEMMYKHLHVILPGHRSLTHHLAHKTLLRNIRNLELAMSTTDKFQLDLRRLPKLETLLLDFRGRVRYMDIYHSLPHKYPYLPFADSPSLREYLRGVPVWKEVIKAILALVKRKNSDKARVLCCFESGLKETCFEAAGNDACFYDLRTGIETGAVEYEYEEDFYRQKEL